MIDYTQADFTSSGQTFDVIFDVAAKYKDLLHRTELIEAGALTAVIEERFPLERTADAPRRVEAAWRPEERPEEKPAT